MKLSAKEKRMLSAIFHSEYNDIGPGDAGNSVWTQYVMEDCGGTRANAGVASSLVKKGLIGTTGAAPVQSKTTGEILENGGTIWLTVRGADAVREFEKEKIHG